MPPKKLKNKTKIIFIQKHYNNKSRACTPSEKKDDFIKVGAIVFVASIQKNGIIEYINANSVSIRVGIVKFCVKKSDIFEAVIDKNNSNNIILSKKYELNAENYLDIHGLTVDEALKIIEKNLYAALALGLPSFEIVHGKGSGILQKSIHKYLKTIPEVKDFSFALPHAGGSGKTIVHLAL